jgi:DNA polymerase-3 subunit gamma/tau
MALNLYRKYRPTKLADVIGQPAVTTALTNALKSKKLSHAYLFIGPRGTGKTSVARIFAHEVNHYDYEIEDSYVDIIEIDAASNTGVDNIRELREKAAIAPSVGPYKIYLIDEVHMLSKSAFNALLKTLEEPPEHVIFLMATTNPEKIPVTIISRAQTFTFHLADPDTMQKHLRKISDLEKIHISDDALALIVRRGDGSFRDSLSLLDQITLLASDDKTEITAQMIEDALGLPSGELTEKILSASATGDLNALTELLKTGLSSGLSATTLAKELIAKILSAPKPEYLPLLSKLPTVSDPFASAKLLVALAPATQPIAPTQTETTVKNAPQNKSHDAWQDPHHHNNFSWDDFLANFNGSHMAIYTQLTKVSHDLKDNTLHLYPSRLITKTILSSTKNQDIIKSKLNGLSLVIHDPGDQPQNQDSTFAQISAIMGNIQEVKLDGKEPSVDRE